MDGVGLPSSLAVSQVDVFAEGFLTGNPAAVVWGAPEMDAALMHAIARETNLSETVFLFPPRADGDAFMRTFTTRREIPFAVHPALAAAHAHCERAGDLTFDRLTLEYSSGSLDVWRDGSTAPWFATVPEATFETTDVRASDVAAALGLAENDIAATPPQIVATGAPWLLIEVATRDAFDRILPDHTAIAMLTQDRPAVGLTVYLRAPSANFSVALRTFAPAEGIYEDPVCGSCAGSVAAALCRQDPAFAASPIHRFAQGHALKRPGAVSVRLDDRGIHVGGRTLTVMRGHFDKEITPCPA